MFLPVLSKKVMKIFSKLIDLRSTTHFTYSFNIEKSMRNFILLIFGFLFFNAQTFAQEQLSDQLRAHTSFLAADSLEGRGLGTLGKEKAEQYIIDQFRNAGLESLKPDYRHGFQFRSGLAWIPATNLVGVIRGNDPVLKDEFIVIGAHYDHLGYTLKNGGRLIFPGADDNASGVASIIELAKYINDNKNELKRSVIIVAFDAEESGLYGADRFLKDSIVDPSQIRFMFSLDMVGMYKTHGGLDLKGMESLAEGASIASKLAAKHQIKIKKMGAAIENRTDTKPFGDKGIPSVHVFTGLKSPYHKPEDKSDLLDYDGMAIINRFMADLAMELSTHPTLTPVKELVAVADPENSKKKSTKFFTGVLINNGVGYQKYSEQFYRSSSSYNFSAGFYSQFHFHRLLAIQPEVLYDFNQGKTTNGRYHRNSLTVPLNIQVGTPTVGSGFRAFLFVGPYYRYNFSAKWPGENWSAGKEFNQDEWGMSYGIGIDFNKFHIAWTFRRGLTEVMDHPDFGPIKDRHSLFTLGYRF
jgi:aminopeptidase YwaD